MAGARIIEWVADLFEKALYRDVQKDAATDAERYTADADSKLSQRIAELKTDGPGSHGPQRHLEVSDSQLRQRLGRPVLNPDGTAWVGSDGFVKTTGQVDPMTGSTTDAISGVSHKCRRFATRFDSAADYAYADRVLREQADATGNGFQSAPIEGLLGADGPSRMTGYYVDPVNPTNYLPVDFRGGSIKALYQYDNFGKPYLFTMYPDPAPGLHP